MVKQAATTKKKATTSKPVAVLETGADLKTALLIVSLIGNAFIICIWVALKVTSQYDTALSLFFLDR
ncbi:MAG: hypothetical protein ACSLEY_03715 [Candidatus Saccharimonadales bacterium]